MLNFRNLQFLLFLYLNTFIWFPFRQPAFLSEDSRYSCPKPSFQFLQNQLKQRRVFKTNPHLLYILTGHWFASSMNVSSVCSFWNKAMHLINQSLWSSFLCLLPGDVLCLHLGCLTACLSIFDQQRSILGCFGSLSSFSFHIIQLPNLPHTFL